MHEAGKCLADDEAIKGMDDTKNGLENGFFTMRSALQEEKLKYKLEVEGAEHSTSAKCAGHAGFGSVSMRTHSIPAKTAGHAGDGLASMRMHSTLVKSAEHDGDGLASVHTHPTPVKSAR